MKPKIELNEVTKRLPKHLHRFIIPQPYESYTAQNHAVWRYVMRKNVNYLKDVAHGSYLGGISKTGVTIDAIPKIQGMNRILKEIGWAAISVDGFIPPNAFMEFQTYNVLVIASDIRTINHMEYTPAPDIIHEAAGHAPIIANPEYAEYLRRFGAIGSKAISSAHDYHLYEAVRLLSIVKEDPNATAKEIKEAQEKLVELQHSNVTLSEMTKIRNLHWWTVEYGLVGTVENPKIYGAGLLSSIGESKWCMRDEVLKIPYSIKAASQNFDITQPQPQLFVTPDFAYLSCVLESFANTMSLRKGGLSGIQALIESQHLGTITLSTGIQISGIFSKVYIDHQGRPAYFQTMGETALAYEGKELIGHGKKYHTKGFGSPIGKLKGSNLAIEDMYPKDLEIYRIYEGRHTQLEFESGVVVEGEVITGKRSLQGKIILISFKNCKVTLGDELLFHPDWGVYDMAVGKEVTSAFAGAADADSFEQVAEVSRTKTRKIRYAKRELKLHELYAKVRKMRHSKKINLKSVRKILTKVEKKHPDEWLLLLEIYELLQSDYSDIAKAVQLKLQEKSKNSSYGKLISEGLQLLSNAKH